MRGILSSPSGPALAELPEPVAGPGLPIVRVRAALIVPGDLRAARSQPPIVPGQAFVGRVEEGGTSRRVAVHPVVRCGRCDRCQGGLSAHCRERRIIGFLGHAGGFAERVAVPSANLVAIPDAVDDEQAAFAVPIAVAVEATRHVRIEGKTYITVLGDDVLALVAVQVMSRLNASVRLVARARPALAAADRLGVKHRHADEVGRRGDQDVVVDCIGSAESLAFAAELVRARGSVVLAGAGPGAAVAADLSPIVANELRVQGSFYGPLAEAVALLALRAIQTTPLVERKAGLAEIPAALRFAAEPGRLGVLLRMTPPGEA